MTHFFLSQIPFNPYSSLSSRLGWHVQPAEISSAFVLVGWLCSICGRISPPFLLLLLLLLTTPSAWVDAKGLIARQMVKYKPCMVSRFELYCVDMGRVFSERQKGHNWSKRNSIFGHAATPYVASTRSPTSISVSLLAEPIVALPACLPASSSGQFDSRNPALVWLEAIRNLSVRVAKHNELKLNSGIYMPIY
jgi:hypothetical protein